MKVKNLAFFGIMASILGVSAANAESTANGILTTKAYVDKGDTAAAATALQSAKDYTDTALTNFTPSDNIADNSLDGAKLQSGTVAEAKLDSTLANKINAAAVASSLATVATTGAYSDLSGTPNLAAVATTGAYSDLSGTPTLATVATSGDYNDLTNKPTAATYVAATIDSTDTTHAPSGQAVSSAITGINTALGGKQATINAQNTLDGAYLTNGTVSSAKLDTALSSTISGKLDANAAIQAGTHTKITYDANGLVTSGTSLATSDLPVPTVNIDGAAQTCPTGTRCVLTYTNNTWSLTPMSATITE